MEENDPQRSDQLPEENPAETVPEDEPNRQAQGSGEEKARTSGSEDRPQGQATGNPDNAG